MSLASTQPPASQLPIVVVPPPPVIAPTRTVDLLVVRFDNANGPITVSNGIPLQKGAYKDTDLPNIHLLIQGQEVAALHIEALGGRFSDGSLRSVLVQFQLPNLLASDQLPGMLELGANGRVPGSDLPLLPTSSKLASAALPSDPNYLVKTQMAGPLLTLQDAASGPTIVTAMDGYFPSVARGIYQAIGPTNLRSTATYDHLVTHYQYWMRTADPAWFKIANEMGDAFNTYAAAQNGGLPEWNNETQGFPIHYWMTGHQPVRQTLEKMVMRAIKVRFSSTRQIRLNVISTS